MIFIEKDISLFSKYLEYESKYTLSGFDVNPFANESIGFGLDIRSLQQCVDAKSNQPYWDSKIFKNVWDLRNPKNLDIKREIFQAFGLDADKTYEENLCDAERMTCSLAP